MARIFSISFQYKNTPFSAMISVQKTPFHTEYHINMMDEKIKGLLPADKIISSSPGHYAFSGVSTISHSPLMNEIIAAVSNHIHLEYITKQEH